MTKTSIRPRCIPRDNANWKPLFQKPAAKDKDKIGIPCFYIHGFSHIRVHVRAGYQYGNEPIQEFYLSREHPQSAVIRAATFLYESAKAAYGYTEVEFAQLIRYVTSDEFWTRYYRVATKWQSEQKFRADTVEGKTNLNILTPYQSGRSSETKFITMSTNPKSNGVTVKTTSYLLMRSSPELEHMTLKHTCHSYSEIFRVLALYTAVGLTLFTKDNRRKFGQQYVLAVYLNYASAWRHKIEKDGLDGYFFDHESKEFGLTLAYFTKRVDAELNYISGKSVFGHSIDDVEILGPSFIREDLGNSNDVFDSYNANRSILLTKILKNFPDHFTTKDLQSYCRELGMKTFHANQIVKWGGVTPYTYGNNTWFISDKDCEKDPVAELPRSERLVEYILKEMHRRGKVFFTFPEAAVLFRNDLSRDKLLSISYSSKLIVRKTDGKDTFYCAHEHAKYVIDPSASPSDIDKLEIDCAPVLSHSSIDKEYVIRLSPDKTRFVFNGIYVYFRKSKPTDTKYRIRLDYRMDGKSIGITPRNLKHNLLDAVRYIIANRSFTDPDAVYKEAYENILCDDFLKLLKSTISAKADQKGIASSEYSFNYLEQVKVHTYLNIKVNGEKIYCISELSKPRYKLSNTVDTPQELIKLASFHCFKMIQLRPDNLFNNDEFVLAVVEQVAKALGDKANTLELTVDSVKARINSESLLRLGIKFFENHPSIENSFFVQAEWNELMERSVYEFLLNLAVGTTFTEAEVRDELAGIQMSKSAYAFKSSINKYLVKYGATPVPNKSVKTYVRRKLVKKLKTPNKQLAIS